MALTTSSKLYGALDTGGFTYDVPALTVVDNIMVFAGGTGTGKVQRMLDGGKYRAAWGGCFGVGDKTVTLQAIFNHASVQTVVIDTVFTINGTVTIPSTKRIVFENGGRIDGVGTLTGGLLQASNRQQVFASTLNITNVRTHDGIWSAMWMGAKGDNVADDVVPLQKGIDYCIANTVNVKSFYLPGGIYKITKGLLILERNGVEYNQVNIRVFGDIVSQRIVTGDETWISCTSDNSFAIGVQENKGTLIENLGIVGTNAISYSQAVAYNPATTYVLGAQRTNRFSPQAGIVLDPFAIDPALADQYPDFTAYYTNSSNGGSTSCIIRNVKVRSFVVGIVMGPNGGTQNNECHIFDHIWLENVREGISTCYSQERLTKCTNIYAWNNVRTVFDTQTYGSRHGDAPIVDGVNTAGNVYELMNLGGGLGSVVMSFSNVYCESLYRIGSSPGHLSGTFTKCNFKFVDPTAFGLKMQDWLYEDGNASRTHFIGCNFLYFYANGQYPMNFASSNLVFTNCKLNQQVGTYYSPSVLQSAVKYDNVSFYGGVTGIMMDRDISAFGQNHSQYPGGRFVEMGNVLATVVPNSGVGTPLTYQTRQMREIISPFIKRVLLATNVAVTVTGSTATCTIPGLANVPAYNGRLVYVYLNYGYTGRASSYSGGQVMRLVSIDGSGVVTFDRVMESFVTGTYILYVELPQSAPIVSVANVSGTSITNWYIERTGLFTPSANGLYSVAGSGAYLQTTATVGAGTATITASQTASVVTFSSSEYIEYGFSNMTPTINPDFPQYTVFTKGAKYINNAFNTTVPDVVYWVCTKSGSKGSGVIEPEFTPVYASEPQDYSDKFTLTATGSRTVALGQTLYEIHLKCTTAITLDIGTAAAGTDIQDQLVLAANTTAIIDYKRTADAAFSLFFTSAAFGGGTLTVRLVKKTIL